MAERAFWNERIEKMPVDQLKALQLERLKQAVKKAAENSEYYKSSFAEVSLKPGQIKTLEDVQKIPFLDPERMQKSGPYGLATVPRKNLTELHEISANGTSLWLLATKKDIAYWADLYSRQLWMVGLRPGDVLQNSYKYGLHTAAFGFHYGATLIGVMIVPSGVGQTEMQIDTIRKFGVNAICMTPSYALYLYKHAKEKGIDLSKFDLTLGLFGAEPFSDKLREELDKAYKIKSFNVFGMTEYLGPGMSCECSYRQGLHTWADAFLIECVDPITGEWVKEGEEGEIVWTWLTGDGTSLIRYRSRDLSTLIWDECDCGRTHPRITPIRGRTDEGVPVGGLVIFPKQFKMAIKNIPELNENFQAVIERKNGLDKIVVRAEVSDPELLKNRNKVSEIEEIIRKSVKDRIEVKPQRVELLKPDELVKKGEKIKAIEDKRVLV